MFATSLDRFFEKSAGPMRLQRLQAVAAHPATPFHEAASARARISELQARTPAAAPAPPDAFARNQAAGAARANQVQAESHDPILRDVNRMGQENFHAAPTTMGAPMPSAYGPAPAPAPPRLQAAGGAIANAARGAGSALSRGTGAVWNRAKMPLGVGAAGLGLGAAMLAHQGYQEDQKLNGLVNAPMTGGYL